MAGKVKSDDDKSTFDSRRNLTGRLSKEDPESNSKNKTREQTTIPKNKNMFKRPMLKENLNFFLNEDAGDGLAATEEAGFFIIFSNFSSADSFAIKEACVSYSLNVSTAVHQPFLIRNLN